MKKTKDLPPKSPAKVKGGKILLNENMTLERSAKPKVGRIDLTPKSPTKVKGGRIGLNDNSTFERAGA